MGSSIEEGGTGHRRRLRWGVMGTANIARNQVIPGIRAGDTGEVVAIASRSEATATAFARELGIPRAYGTYEAVLDDDAVDAVYIPLPNHLHVPWSIRAAEAGKHVLCEKPIALSAAEALDLLRARDRTGRVICEAFMVRSHPRWHALRQMIRDGRIGTLTLVTGHFSYSRRDPSDVRSHPEWGGGVLYDIGVYPVTLARFVFEAEPVRVSAALELDPDFKVDRLTSGILEFPDGRMCSFTCGGQLVPWQRMQLFGTRGRIEVEIPFNAIHDRPSRVLIDDGSALDGAGIRSQEFPPVNQYALQADAFARAVWGEGAAPVPLEDSVANMRVIDALFAAGRSGSSQAVEG